MSDVDEMVAAMPSEEPPVSPAARTIRHTLAGARWWPLLGGYYVPPEELLQLVMENRRLKGLPVLVSYDD